MVTTNELLASQLLQLSGQRGASPIARGIAGFLGARNLRAAEQEKRAQLDQQRQALASALGGLGGVDPSSFALPQLQQALLSRLTAEEPEPVKLGEGEVLVSPRTGEQIAVAPVTPLSEQRIQRERAQTRKFDLEADKLAKQIEGGLRDPGKVFEQTSKLRKEFTGLSDGFIEQRNAFNRIMASAQRDIVDGVEVKSPAADLALIFNYMKLLDPGSVVREGEFATARNAAGVPERIRAQFNKLQSGEDLTTTQRKDFVDRANKLFNSAKRQQDKLTSKFTDLAIRANLPPEDVAIDLGLVPIEVPTGDPGTATGQPSVPDGTVIENAETGERQILRNGVWEDL